jgi:hypothetical protein
MKAQTCAPLVLQSAAAEASDSGARVGGGSALLSFVDSDTRPPQDWKELTASRRARTGKHHGQH